MSIPPESAPKALGGEGANSKWMTLLEWSGIVTLSVALLYLAGGVTRIDEANAHKLPALELRGNETTEIVWVGVQTLWEILKRWSPLIYVPLIIVAIVFVFWSFIGPKIWERIPNWGRRVFIILLVIAISKWWTPPIRDMIWDVAYCNAIRREMNAPYVLIVDSDGKTIDGYLLQKSAGMFVIFSFSPERPTEPKFKLVPESAVGSALVVPRARSNELKPCPRDGARGLREYQNSFTGPSGAVRKAKL